ncbi:MAG: radical SAM protein, partial [Phascolarctobacterium sp.]|nr:radical SAM protein [Phascolarctobacterium sp.]
MAIIPIFIPHAGCPHQCVFCNQKTISGQKTAALEGAKEQINRWLERVKPSVENEAAFYGGSFTGLDITLQKELLALTDELLARKVIGSVRLSTRPDYIDDERLELLRNHGVKLVELGVQSLDDKVLAAAERGHAAEQVTNAVALLKKYDFKVGLQLMVGMPEQDFASVKDTVEKVLVLKPDIARIYPLLVIKGTPLAKNYEAGEFEPLSLEEAVEQAAYMYKKLSEAGIKIIRVGLQPDDELCAEGNI